MSAVAVTGAAGFLGSAVAATLVRRGHSVVAIDVVPPARTDGVVPVTADVRDAGAVLGALQAHDVRTVVHAAAIAGVDAVRRDLVGATSVTVVGMAAVLAASVAARVERVIDLSSEEVYGSPRGELIGEDAHFEPSSAYGAHKAACELLGRTAEGVQYVAARLSWVYGRGFPRARPPQPWLDDAAAGLLSAPSGGADHVADLLHVDDAADAVVALAEAGNLEHHAYNVGSGIGASLGRVAELIRAERPGWTVDLTPGALPGVAQRPPLSIERIREELAWTPDLSLEAGLRRTLHGR
jgi:nucleoside-diphosphate-sugar epimerase